MTISKEITLTDELAQVKQVIASRLDQHSRRKISPLQRANHMAIRNWLTNNWLRIFSRG